MQKKQEQIFVNILKNCWNYDINRRGKRDFKLFGISEQLEEKSNCILEGLKKEVKR